MGEGSGERKKKRFKVETNRGMWCSHSPWKEMIPQRGTKKEKEQDRDIESEERERTAAKAQESRWRRLEGLRETELKSRGGK